VSSSRDTADKKERERFERGLSEYAMALVSNQEYTTERSERLSNLRMCVIADFVRILDELHETKRLAAFHLNPDGPYDADKDTGQSLVAALARSRDLWKESCQRGAVLHTGEES